MVTKRNIYHPFLNKSIGFLINSKGGKYSEEFFADVNLYWQPVQDPTIGIPFFIIYLLVILAGGFVHYHLWKMLKREDSLVSNIMKAYVIVQMTLWPFWTTVATATYFIYPLSEVIGSWFCVFSYFLIYFGIIFISFQSTIIAIMRYIFTVHAKGVEKFGKQRTQNLFYWILGIVPILMAVWLYFGAINGNIDGLPTLNRCNGSHDKIFQLKWSFSERVSVWSARCAMDKNNQGLAPSIDLIKTIQCRASAILVALLCSNRLDGFIYYRTWAHITTE